GSLISARQLLENGYYNHKFVFEQGCLQAQCSTQLSDFFKQRRSEKKQNRLSKNVLK
ncbi:MAG: tRNA-specific adenosine deaminase, partial [Acinetobacter sp.]|nr:tRNA-specific adenosine deaminase [Acinetobacter sp.]